jgi:hypothetical protein
MNIVPATVRRTLRSLRVRAVATAVASGRGTGHGTSLAVLVAALILGIVGMHALVGHGTPATSAALPSTTSMAGMTSGTAVDPPAQGGHSSRAHDSQANDGGTHTSQVFGDSGDEGPGHGDGMSTLMLCAAVLTAVALTLLTLLIAGVFRPLLPAVFAPAALRARPLQWVRGTGPPHEWQFSVIRC